MELELFKQKFISNITYSYLKDSLKEITQIFKKFKEYDVKIQKLNQATRGLEKLEKKYLGEIKRCPPSKNIRDYELRYAKAKSDKECAELKRKLN